MPGMALPFEYKARVHERSPSLDAHRALPSSACANFAIIYYRDYHFLVVVVPGDPEDDNIWKFEDLEICRALNAFLRT